MADKLKAGDVEMERERRKCGEEEWGRRSGGDAGKRNEEGARRKNEQDAGLRIRQNARRRRYNKDKEKKERDRKTGRMNKANIDWDL